jgi:DNA recombination protein Rad52
MTFTAKQSDELAKPLDPKHVVKPTGQFGAKGDYIEGWHAIAEANRIFGHDGWSYTIQLIQDSLIQADIERERNGQKHTEKQWQAAYTCICTVSAGGATRQDVGFGSGFAKQIGDAIEGATKEAATDALKRALRTFGHPFGLALYDKSRANVQAPPVPVIDDAQWAELAQLVEATKGDTIAMCEHYKVKSLRELTVPQFEHARDTLRRRLPNPNKKAA